MSKIVTKIKELLTKLVDFIAEEEKLLPVGMAEFHTWADTIIAKAGSFANTDSMKYALATMILHAEHSMSKATDSYFVARLRKSAANQVASQVFQDIKTKQEAAQQQAVNPVDTTPETNNDKETRIQAT